ncbi:MAG: penicillin acylase family protein, partial [Gammaproteobacteria bacterium]|nr:penicillin acylase family protein [Gammaproteobacteria bacterium]
MGYIDRFRKSLKYILLMGVIIYLGWLIWLAIGFYLVKSNYKQEHHNLNISKTIKINRDEHAIPFIDANSKSDAIFGLGFVHAQDRYWQMMMMREAAKGRLASHFGQELLNHDRFVKTLDLEGLAQKTYVSQSPETKAYLDKYTSGINAWRSQHENNVLPLTPENFIFQINFEPWQPEDCLLIQKYMNFDL